MSLPMTEVPEPYKIWPETVEEAVEWILTSLSESDKESIAIINKLC